MYLPFVYLCIPFKCLIEEVNSRLNWLISLGQIINNQMKIYKQNLECCKYITISSQWQLNDIHVLTIIDILQKLTAEK